MRAQVNTKGKHTYLHIFVSFLIQLPDMKIMLLFKKLKLFIIKRRRRRVLNHFLLNHIIIKGFCLVDAVDPAFLACYMYNIN